MSEENGDHFFDEVDIGGGWQVDYQQRTCTGLDGKEVKLTPVELRLLTTFSDPNCDRPVRSRQAIARAYARLCNPGEDVIEPNFDDKLVPVMIANLRKKIPGIIQTRHEEGINWVRTQKMETDKAADVAELVYA